jgi:hypothetical protein
MFPPVDPTRRRLLTVAAGGAVAAAVPSAALSAPAIDPILGLIEAHRNAHAAHMAALELQNRLERKHGIGSSSWVSEKPCHDENDAFEALISTPATTLNGLFAKLSYLEDLGSEFETEWMVDERANPTALIQSFAASLKNIGVWS